MAGRTLLLTSGPVSRLTLSFPPEAFLGNSELSVELLHDSMQLWSALLFTFLVNLAGFADSAFFTSHPKCSVFLLL